METIGLAPNLDVGHLGPPLEKGRLPAVFYFALSAQESLDLDPYNQPAVFLANLGVRVFSLNLPAHGPNLNALEAIGTWAQNFSEGIDPLAPFLEQASFAIDALIDKGLIVREKIGVMGLSRGGLIASHVAKSCADVRAITAFAPMIALTKAREFVPKHTPGASEYNLVEIADELVGKPLRFYIGNRDTRVGTKICFDFVEDLVERSFQKGIRSPEVELLISPSIGHMGHGTSKAIFESGAAWIAEKLGVKL